MSDILKELRQFKKSFDVHLQNILENEITHAVQISKELGWLLSTMKNFSLSGGKRLRPFLFFESVKGLQRNSSIELTDEHIISMAVFIELVHLELLVLDDIMDKSPTRHGIETIHLQEKKKFAFEFGEKDAEHFGISAGILSGVIFGNIAMKVLAHSSESINSSTVLSLVHYYNTVIIETAYGQFHDMYASSEKMINDEQVRMIHLYKTAKYTIEAPLVAGAVVCGILEKDIEQIKGFAEPLGSAFQIVDDLIGTFGTDELIGKSVKSDLEEGKHTFLTVKAYEMGNASQKEELLSLLRRGEITDKEFIRFKEIVTSTGSRKYSEELAVKLLDESLRNIALSSYNDSAKARLKSLAEFIIKRDY